MKQHVKHMAVGHGTGFKNICWWFCQVQATLYDKIRLSHHATQNGERLCDSKHYA
jgi:hypothetical protein